MTVLLLQELFKLLSNLNLSLVLGFPSYQLLFQPHPRKLFDARRLAHRPFLLLTSYRLHGPLDYRELSIFHKHCFYFLQLKSQANQDDIFKLSSRTQNHVRNNTCYRVL